jgi:predicted SAM-dependent methyltransferase
MNIKLSTHRVITQHQPKLLILGSGKKDYKEYTKEYEVTRLDMNPNVNPDVIHDLNIRPWPFEDDQFDLVIMEHVLEHLTDVVGSMEELHRITRGRPQSIPYGVGKPCGRIRIVVPYFRSKWACIDPTHQHYFTADTLNYFIKGHTLNERYTYTDVKFTQSSMKFNHLIDQTLFQKALIPIAEHYTEFYENYLSTIWPLETLTYDIHPVK